MVRYLLLTAAALAAAGFASDGVASRAGEPKGAASPEPDWSGKVVFVQTQKDAAVLEKVQVKRLGDRFFVVGRALADDELSNNPFAGAMMYFPLSDVTRLAVSDSLDQLRRSVAARRKR